MCDRCEAIDRELVGFRRLQANVEDEFALVLIAEAVKDLQSERAALHADDAKASDGYMSAPEQGALICIKGTRDGKGYWRDALDPPSSVEYPLQPTTGKAVLGRPFFILAEKSPESREPIRVPRSPWTSDFRRLPQILRRQGRA